MMKKRGQVTIFVILGLLILILIGLYFYLTSKPVQPSIDVPRLAGDAGQVQEFVDGCLEQVARTGLIELGRHGGYIDPTDTTYTLRALDYNALDQSESDMAFLNRNDEKSGIPYWYYARSSKSCWHCEASTLSPPPELMAYQLGKYVDAHIQECLDNYKPFQDKGFEITSVTNTSTIAILTEESVGFLTEYTLQIVKDGETSYIERFYKEIDIPLLKYYATAVKITQSEIDTEYLDFYGLYLLGQFMGMDPGKLPPISALRIGYNTVFWSKINTRRLYESLLTSYTPFFKVIGTNNEINYTLRGRPMELKMYEAMNLPMFTDEEKQKLDLKNREINHIYSGEPIYLNVRPSDGDVISPLVIEGEDLGGVVSMDPDKSYEFFYDISYPVMVEIKDSRPGKEYSFMFALQGNIKENKLLSDWIAGFGTLPWDESYINMYTDVPIGTETTDLETGENYTYEAPQVGKTLFCDEAQRLSGTIKVRAYDALTSQALDGVMITYNCGTYANCYVGNTVYNATLKDTLFASKLPICMNGYMLLSKEGYLSKKMPLTTEYHKSQYLGSVYMDKVYTKNVTIQKHFISRIEINTSSGATVFKGYDFGPAIDLSTNDTVTITLRKITMDDWDEPWTKTIILGRDNPGNISVDLVPGMYILDANLMDYGGVTVPKNCQKIKVKGGDDMWIPEEDIKMEIAMWGGVKFDEQNPFVITPEDLMSGESIQFSIVRAPAPRCINDMNVMTLVESFTRNYRSDLYPKFY
jgi:hypothetical protein